MCLPPQDGRYCEQLAETRHNQTPNKKRRTESHQESGNITLNLIYCFTCTSFYCLIIIIDGGPRNSSVTVYCSSLSIINNHYCKLCMYNRINLSSSTEVRVCYIIHPTCRVIFTVTGLCVHPLLNNIYLS